MIDKEGDGPEAGAQEAAVVEEGAEPSPDQVKLEAEAREMGWKPKEAWKGDPEGWRPADEFVKRGKEIIPILNARLREKDNALEKLRRESAEQIERVSQMGAKALKMQREQLEARYDTARERAVEQGDTKTFQAVEKAKKDALAKFDTEVAETGKVDPGKPSGTNNYSATDKAVMAEWMDENQWFSATTQKAGKSAPKNPVLFAAAHEAWDKFEEEMPGAPIATILAAVKAEVEREFPERFGRKPSGNGAAKVESANGRGPEGGSADDDSQWGKVPAEVRNGAAKNQIEEERVFDHLVGAKKGTPLTAAQLKAARKEYAKLYFQN